MHHVKASVFINNVPHDEKLRGGHTMTTQQQDNSITERQERAIRNLSAKAGVKVPENVGAFSRVQASEYLDHLFELVDGPQAQRPRLQEKRSSEQGTVGDRCRVALSAKLVYGRLARAGKDPLEDQLAFKKEVMAVHEVLRELEQEAR